MRLNDIPFESSNTQSKFDLCDGSRYFKFEIAQNKYVTIRVDDIDKFIAWFRTLSEDERYFYEVLPELSHVAEYYDIDYTGVFTENDFECMSDLIIETFLQKRNEFMPTRALQRRDIIVLESNRTDKISIRIFSKKTYYTKNSYQKSFVKALQEHCRNTKTFFDIDGSVYSKNRLMRLYQNKKRLSNVPLRVYKPHVYAFASLKETLIIQDDFSSYRCMDSTVVCDGDVKIDMEEILNFQANSMTTSLKKWLETHPELKVVGTRLHRLARTPCFIECSDTHSTENGYWFERDGATYVSCFTHNHPICVGKTPYHKAEMKLSEFQATDILTQGRLPPYSQFLPFKTLLVKAPFGSGKSVQAFEYAKNFEQVLVISHRVSLTVDLRNRFGFESYLDRKFDAPKLICCLNSLSQVQNPTRFNLIIIDEISAVLRQTNMRNSDMRMSVKFFVNFMRRLNVPIIAMDGTLSNSDVQLIRCIRDDPHMKILYIPPQIEHTKKVEMYEKREEIEQKIVQDVQDGKKVAIGFSCSVRSIQTFLKLHDNIFSTKKILFIHQNNKSLQLLQPDYWMEHDVVIYSPSIAEGFSFEKEYFDTVYAIGSSLSSPPSSFAQQIARIRAIKTVRVFLDNRRCLTPLLKNEEEVETYCLQNMRHLHSILSVSDIDENFHCTIMKDIYWKMFVKNKIEMSHAYHHYKPTFFQCLFDNGYDIYMMNQSQISQSECRKYNKQSRQCKQIVEYEEINQIVEAIDITEEDALRIDKNYQRTPDDYHALQKYRMKRDLLVDTLTKEHVFYYKEHNTKLQNLKRCVDVTRHNGSYVRMEFPSKYEYIQAETKTRMKTAVDFLDQLDVIMSKKYHQLNLLHQWIQKLGFRTFLVDDYVDDETFLLRLQQIVNEIDSYDKWKEYQYLFMRTCSLKIYNQYLQSPIHWILELFGNILGICFYNYRGRRHQKLDFYVSLCDDSTKPRLLDMFYHPDMENDSVIKDIISCLPNVDYTYLNVQKMERILNDSQR